MRCEVFMCMFGVMRGVYNMAQLASHTVTLTVLLIGSVTHLRHLIYSALSPLLSIYSTPREAPDDQIDQLSRS